MTEAVSGALGAGAFLAGLLILMVELACASGFAWLVVARRAPELRGAPRGVALGLFATLGVIAIQVAPLVFGVLTRGTVITAALALLGGGALVRPRVVTTNCTIGIETRHNPLSIALAGIGCVAFVAFSAAWLSTNLTIHPVSVDALSFHFPGVFRYIQSGSLWKTAQYLPGQAQGNYPQSGDMLLLALVLPWHSLAFVRLVDPLLLALAATALYALGVELGAPKPTALLAALAVCTVGPALQPALIDVLVDPAFLAGLSAGALFLVRYRRTGASLDILLAGLGFGLALGTKWYGLTDVPVVIAVWIACELLGGRSLTAVRNSAAALIGVTALTGGIWMVRNLVLTGNPVFDYQVKLLGLTIFPAPPNPIRTLEGFSLLHYATHFSILRTYVWPVFRSDFGLTGLLLVLGAIAALALELRGRSTRFEAPTILAVAAVLCALVYFATPYSAQGRAGMPILVDANTRYGIPALLLAAPLLAFVGAKLSNRLRPILDAALLVLMIIDLRRYIESGAGRIAAIAVVITLVTAAVIRLPAFRQALRTPRFAAPLIGLIAVGFAALGFHYQKVLARRPYYPSDPTVDYVLAHAPTSTRIAITGEWTAQGLVPVAPLFGPRLGNDVSFIGPWIQHRLEEYTRHSEHAFLAQLNAGDFAYLEIGTGFPPRPDPMAERWAATDGWVPVAASSRLVLMRRAGA